MKKTFLILLLGLAGWAKLPAQCLCDFQLEIIQDPADPCCFDVLFCNNLGPACDLSSFYSPLIISTGNAPIASLTPGNPNIAVSQQGSFQAVFTGNLVSIGLGCAPKVNIGRICLDNAPNSQVVFSASLYNQGVLSCFLPLPNPSFAVPACSSPAFFEKICGGDQEDYPTAVKAFGDGVYVSGYRLAGNVEHGTFKKYDLNTGALVWEKELSTPSRIVDFEYDPAADGFLLVGWTTPLSASVNNRSILIKVDDQGNQVFSKYYEQDGREGFTRIVRHPNPPDPANPYYILGRKNPPAASPSSSDVVVLFNVNAAGTFNWAREYAYSTNPTDDEFFLGLFPYGPDLIMTGLVTGNDGALLRIDGLNGSVLEAVRYPQAMDIHDGIGLWSGMVAIVGENAATNQAFVMVVNPFINFSTAFGNPASLEFPNIRAFKDIWVDKYGKLYVIGENKNSMLGKNYQVVHKLDYFFHGGVSNLSVDWAKYLEDLLYTETSYTQGVISVTPSHDAIFYADSRLKTSPFFGSWDMLTGVYDLGMIAACEFAFPFPNNPLNLTTNPIPVADFPVSEPQFISPQIQNLASCCTSFCSAEPCTADLTWQLGNCFEVAFTASSSTCLPGGFIYDWDFGDGNTATTSVPSINHTFPCGGGIFTVCVTVTDPFMCVATVCYQVNVNNSNGCAVALSPSLICNANDFDAFDYTINIQHLPQSPAVSCTYTVVSLQPNVVLSNPAQVPAVGVPTALLTGTATVTSGPTPAALNLVVQMVCACPSPPGGSFTGSMPVSIPTICCKSVGIPLPFVCEDDLTLDVFLHAFGTLYNINQVSWFVQPVPASGICPAPPNYWGGIPFQDNLTGTLDPLHLFPASANGNLCVYAVVHLNDGPCTTLFSNIAPIEFCGASTCDLLSDQQFCYMGSPVVPSPFNLALNSPPNACFPSIEWFGPDGSSVQQGGMSYSPAQGLSMSNPMQDCYEDFFYTVRITDECGQRECKARVRLYSDDAPKGTLALDPFEPQTFCPDEDATLHFIPGCDSDSPKTWSWFTRPCDPSAGSASPIPNTGDMNDYLNTNQLTTSAWYYVETQNGPCPIDSVQLLIEVKEPLAIILFDAIPDPCVEQQVDLSISWTPCTVAGCPPGTPCSPCGHTVEWYKDCTLIGATHEPPGVTASSFTWTTPPLAGNYYAVVKDDCCPDNMETSQLVTVHPACVPVITGPCFRCEGEMPVLTANPSCSNFCGYNWTTANGVIVSAPNQQSITVDAAGTYTVTISCVVNGQVCAKSASYTLIQCQRSVSGVQECGVVSVEELLPPGVSPVRVFPNPTAGSVEVKWETGPKNGVLYLADATGRTLRSFEIPASSKGMTMDISGFPAGLYYIRIQSENELYEVAKLIKH